MNISILIVEDEGLIALDLKKKLEKLGCAVPAIVDNGADALGSVERLRPSLVMMDIGLNGPQDGIATADQIRRRFHIPIVFVTASADRQTLERAWITEPCDYIVKPFQDIDLRARIAMALRKHRQDPKFWEVKPGEWRVF
jgi:CheY-like chemotaxis protein